MATTRLVPADGNHLTVVRDAAEALLALDAGEPTFDLALIESVLPGTSGCELVKRIRATESATHLYIVITASRTVSGDLRAAFAAGADDFIRKPLCREELIARIEAPSRIRQWAGRVSAGRESGSRCALMATLAWTGMEVTIASELSDMIGFALTPASSENALRDANVVAATTLSLPSENIDIRLAVGFDDDGARVLANAMFGDPEAGAAALADMLREIVNISAGAVKRAASTEGRTFTSGVPCNTTLAELHRGEVSATKQWLAARDGDGPTLRFEVQLRVRALRRVKLSAVREGMVVAADLRNAMGGLLMRSGTRIAESHLGGLVSSLGADACIDVVEAA